MTKTAFLAHNRNSLIARSRQRGISLIEGILYLVLALSLVVGGIILFQNAQLSNRVTETARGVVAIASETRALFQNSSSFGAVDDPLNSVLISAGAVPLNFQSDGGIRHPWGGVVSVVGSPTAVGGVGGDQTFSIDLDDIPNDACIRISTVDASGQGTLGVGIEGISFDDGSSFESGEVTVATAETNCETATGITVVYAR